MHSASHISILSNLNPLLPATRQAHPLNWEFDMTDNWLLSTLLVSDFNTCHLCAVLDLDVEEICFVPSWIYATISADWRAPILEFANVDVYVRAHRSKKAKTQNSTNII